EQPMVGSEVSEHPGSRAAAAPDHRGQLVQCTVGQLAAADAGRLQHSEETTRVQIGDRLVGQATKLLGPRRAFTEHGDERLGARQQLLEALRRRTLIGSRLGHCDPLPGEAACPSVLAPSLYGDILSTCQSRYQVGANLLRPDAAGASARGGRKSYNQR